MYRVAIVGRPNVGKSTLFNRLSRTRKALVGNEPGITRDRIFQTVNWDGQQFELIDTGGLVPDQKEEIPEKVLEQAEVAIGGSNLVLLLVDIRAGLTPLDREVASLLQTQGVEFWVVANKADVESLETDAYQFSELGIEKIFPVSAEHNRGIEKLVDSLLERIPVSGKPMTEESLRVAIIGRPNVGKSSLVNCFLGEDRLIVTAIPGTTRDAVDSLFRYRGQDYRIVDTAGIRRKGKTQLMAEKLSVVMARKNMAQADVVLLVIDAVEGATRLDAAIGGYAHEEGRPIILAVNKWDLIEKDTQTSHVLEREYRRQMKFLDYAPLVFVSAKTGQRVFKLLDLAQSAFQSSRTRVSTNDLNRFLQGDLSSAILGRGSRKKFPLKYACQVGSTPPTFVLFLRGKDKLHFSTIRFVTNRLREQYDFFATPIRIIQRPARARPGRR